MSDETQIEAGGPSMEGCTDDYEAPAATTGRSATDGLMARLQAFNAANPLPPDYFAKRVERNLQRMIDAGNVILDTTGEDAEPVKTTRNRKPTVAQVIRQMQRAGVEIAGVEINPRDGTVKVISGKPVGGIDMDDTASPDPRWN